MPLEYHAIMQSGIVEFVVGKDRRRFSIHAALAGNFPKGILEPLMNGEVDEIVFGHCCEFVYSGDYYVPLPISNSPGSEGNQPSISKAHGSVKRWNPMGLTINLFHPALRSSTYAHIIEPLNRVSFHEDGEALNTNPADSYVGVFLSHAELYHFGHRTSWTSLCHLSLYRLMNSLANFTLFEERTGDIARLLKFVFEESEYMEDMQEMLRDYAAWNIEILMQDADFQQLLDRVPPLEKAIFRSMWR